MKSRAWNSTLPQRSRPMSPGKGFTARGTPLAGAGLTTRAGLSRTGRRALEAGQGQRWNSGLHPFPPAACKLIDARDVAQPDEVRCCQRCASTRNLQRHHRRGKASGGSENRAHSQCLCNAVVLCLTCHFWAHVEDRRQAGAEGWIVSQAQDEPAAVSVMRFAEAGGGASQYPTCDGRWLDEMPARPERKAA